MSNQHATELTITRPDDWHLHLRDGSALEAVVLDTARQFARAIVMPNLRPPVTTTEQALAYRARIEAALRKAGGDTAAFTPFDDAVPDRQHAGRGNRCARMSPGRSPRSTVSGRGHHKLRCRRDRPAGQVRRAALAALSAAACRCWCTAR